MDAFPVIVALESPVTIVHWDQCWRAELGSAWAGLNPAVIYTFIFSGKLYRNFWLSGHSRYSVWRGPILFHVHTKCTSFLVSFIRSQFLCFIAPRFSCVCLVWPQFCTECLPMHHVSVGVCQGVHLGRGVCLEAPDLYQCTISVWRGPILFSRVSCLLCLPEGPNSYVLTYYLKSFSVSV